MKRIYTIALATLALSGLAQTAGAGPITVGSQVRLYDGPGGNGGGEFNVDANPFGTPYDFITFCLQRNEYFSYGQTLYVGGITDHTVGGGANDPISPQTAYLYTAFSTQSLANYAFSGSVSFLGNSYDRVATGSALQLAFWFLENELTRDGGGVYHDAYSSATFGTNPLTDFYVSTANAAGWTDIGDVRVLNLFGNYNPTNGYIDNKQDQLYLVTTPEPASLVLLGLGLTGIAMRLRRSRKA